MKSVLIVDDSTIWRNAVTVKLKEAGYTVLCPTDMRDALALAEKHQPQVIVMDLILDHVSGIELLGHLREAPRTCQSSVIITTTASDQMRLAALAQLNVSIILGKNRYALLSLVDHVERCMRAEAAPHAVRLAS
jgi:CheY-like chemotaxis protein